MHFLKFFSLIIFLFVLWMPGQVGASELKQAVIVNPIRGSDFWEYEQGILDTPRKEYEVISANKLSATWLVRFDALQNSEATGFLKSLDGRQETGLFFEVTPSFAQASGVTYNQSQNWHFPYSIFLTGYTPDDRNRLIDTAFGRYKEVFGVYPKSVGAWWIDAYSLGYMREKYGIEANLDVADQYSTDQYQVWGQYWSLPFYPAKANAAAPAGSKEQKIGVVTMQWAIRDPYNAYGNGVGDSTYSVQANDYILHKLDSRYFEKLLDIFPQVTVGLENDFKWEEFGPEYQKQIEILAGRQKKGLLDVKTMSGYAALYRSLYPDISPAVSINADDPLGKGWKVIWYQNSRYRVGWFYGPYGSAIRDLRLFNDSVTESCFNNPCKELNLATTVSKALDDVTFNTRWMLDEGKIRDFKVVESSDGVELSYINQGGVLRRIKFLPNDIAVDGKVQPVSFAILNAVTVPEQGMKKTGVTDLGGVDYPKIISGNLISLAKFIFFAALFFLLPGWVLSRNLLLALPLGWSVFTLVSFIGGYVNFNYLIWGIPLLGLAFIFIKARPFAERPGLSKIKFNLLLLLLVLGGSLSWLLTTVKSGLEYSYGLGFWGPNGHDGIWHLALISELQRSFPPQNPVFAGVPLQNYHYFFDLLLAKFGSLSGIESAELLFRLFPLLIALLSGMLMFAAVKKIAKSEGAGLWAVFLLYFGGSFGWLVNFIREGNFGGESMFWAMQGTSTLLNPPFATSLIFLLGGLYLFADYSEEKKINWRKVGLIALMWGTLIEFKAYGGVLLLGGLGLLTLERLIFKKDVKLIPLFLTCLSLSLAVFLPNNLVSNSLFVFAPFWFVETLISFPDRLYLPRLALTMQSGVLWKELTGFSLGTAAFLIGNLGTRAIGLFSIKNLVLEFRLLFYMLGMAVVIPLLFIQKGTNWNTIQFFYYGIFIFNILAALALARLWQRFGKVAGILGLIVFILLTLPTSYDAVSHYLPSRPPARLTSSELEALTFLRTQMPGTVLTFPFDKYARNKYSEPVPLLAYDSTAYVAAFGDHPTFLEDTVNLDILGIDYKGRLNLQKDFFNNSEAAGKILQENNISFVYAAGMDNTEMDEGKIGVKKIFDNGEVKIYRANQ